MRRACRSPHSPPPRCNAPDSGTCERGRHRPRSRGGSRKSRNGAKRCGACQCGLRSSGQGGRPLSPWSFDACLKPPASCPRSARIRPARSQPARIRPAFRAAGPPAGPSSLTRMMGAVQWAFRYLRSSTETYGMCRLTSIRIAFAMAARPVVIRVNTRSGSHVSSGYRGLWRAIFAGRVTVRNPLRLMQIMPLRTRRSSTSGRPWRLAKQGACPAICTADCPKRPLFRRAPDPL